MPALLKGLELNGYKTFASRADFEFAGNITAIVGPNGSGKSNIADALRWVLGEQSYSLLRGRKTEDMIFSGSEQRPRAGMASATVLFDNSNGWLPIDYSEVSISRRAYRDGQNEYLINGQRVRLRDVSELLAKSGLAERTYTIIGQGLVDAALALRADERRRLFEEAAGIGLYRSRREEAIRRLETTRRNLERVKDIMAELRPRLRSLERQARRAQEYDQVREDLQILLREWYGYHWHNSQQELVKLQEISRTQEGNLETARKKQGEIDSQLSVYRSRSLELRNGLNEHNRNMAALHANREKTSRDLAVLDERRRSLERQQDDLRRNSDRLEEEITFERERLQQVSVVFDQRQLEQTEAQQQLVATQVEFENQRQKREGAESELESIRTRVTELAAQHAEKLARQHELRTRQANFATRKEALTKGIAAAEADLRASENSWNELRTAEQSASSLHNDTSLALAALEDQIAGMQQDRQATQAELSDQQAEMARFQARREVLEQAQNALIGYASGTRMLLQAARQRTLTGLRGALRDFMEVPAEYENAITAALGEYLDAVVVDAGEGVEPALKILKEGQGKSVLLPWTP